MIIWSPVISYWSFSDQSVVVSQSVCCMDRFRNSTGIKKSVLKYNIVFPVKLHWLHLTCTKKEIHFLYYDLSKYSVWSSKWAYKCPAFLPTLIFCAYPGLFSSTVPSSLSQWQQTALGPLQIVIMVLNWIGYLKGYFQTPIANGDCVYLLFWISIRMN